jgi:hypothetical protein
MGSLQTFPNCCTPKLQPLHACHAYTPSYPEPNFFCNISTGKNKTKSTSEEHTRNHIPKGLEKQRTTPTLLHGFKHTTQQTLEVYQQQQQQQQCPGTSDAH